MTTKTINPRPDTSRSARPRGHDHPLWYKDAIIYEVRTRSFFDSNGDGIGDLTGLNQKLDYLADLGITAIWVLPHYPSPGRDDGYDCADYTDVHPDVGTIEDFDTLVHEAHRRGIFVITELVLNHTSDQHPWFQRARHAPPGSPERDFYVWSDSPDRYKDARIIFRDFEPSNWSWDPVAKSYFWHRFFSHQPDLNFENPAVHEAMLGAVDFWFSRGVDGLRLDAVPYLYEAEGTNCENLPATHAFLRKLRAHVDAKFPNRMLLAEANQWPEDAAAYFGDGDECHMNFHFPIMPRLFMSINMEDRFPIIDILKQTPELHPTCQWAMFLRNHDELTLEMVTDEERDYMYRVYAHEREMRLNLGIRRRLAPLVGNDRKKMELLNGLLFSMPGTPVLYYGDEIGMGDNVFLGDRNGVRTPMQWSADRNAGFSRANPQRLILPINIDPEYHYEAINVEAQQSNPNSLLWWTKRMIGLRKRHRAFGRGAIEFLKPENPRVLAFIRRYEDETILVVANLSRHVQFVELDLSSHRGSVPTELMGRTRFPTIGDLPYLLTLGGHDFYWFQIKPPRAGKEDDRRSLPGPIAVTCSSIDELLFGEERPLLEEVLPTFLANRGLTPSVVMSAHITEATRLSDGDSPILYVFVRVEYVEGEPESFALPLQIVSEVPPNTDVVCVLNVQDGAGGVMMRSLVEATTAVAAQLLLRIAASGDAHSILPSGAKLTGGLLHPESSPLAEASPSMTQASPAEARVLSKDRFGTTIAYDSVMLKVLYRVEEGTAPELEVARFFEKSPPILSAQPRPSFEAPPTSAARPSATILAATPSAAPSAPRLPLGAPEPKLTPNFVGFVERRAFRSEPVTLALIEEYVVNEGSAWHRAKSELGRLYERVLAHSSDAPLPNVPSASLLALSRLDPPKEHLEAASSRDWAMLLGRRVADLHLALSVATDPTFGASSYSTMDQRSKYQSARNLVGRALESLRRAIPTLPEGTRGPAQTLASLEEDLLDRFEPLLLQRIDAKQIRCHGDLHLDRALSTGRDFVLLGVGAGRDRGPSERKRRRSALRDVAGVIRSFHYAAATTLVALRDEDQARASRWSWLWEAWTSAAFIRGYLETTAAAHGPYVPSSDEMLDVLLEVSIIEKAFLELKSELARRPEMAWIPIQGLLRLRGQTR